LLLDFIPFIYVAFRIIALSNACPGLSQYYKDLIKRGARGIDESTSKRGAIAPLGIAQDYA
jgi:hypothetical protein